MKSLNNKVAIVTGSSRGIGAQIAITLAEAGASVVINYSSNQKPADKVVSEIKAIGGSAIAIKADISSPEEVKLMFNSAISQFGKINIQRHAQSLFHPQCHVIVSRVLFGGDYGHTLHHVRVHHQYRQSAKLTLLG